MNLSQFMMSYYVMEFHLLQAGINLALHGITFVSLSAWPSMSYSTNDQTIVNAPGAPPPADTPDEETNDPHKDDLQCTPDQTKSKTPILVVGVYNA